MIDYSGPLKMLQKKLNFLNSFGFDKLRALTESSKLAGESLLMSFESSKTGRKIEISYLHTQHGRPSTIVIFIFNKNGESFSLEDWLEMKGKKESINLVLNTDLNILENNFLEQFASSFEKLCRGDLENIINGSQWESVPFDFKGYR